MEPGAANERLIVQQWCRAGPALAEQHADELRRMSTEEALAAAVAVLDLESLLPARERGSGLIEQQRFFSRGFSRGL